MPGTAKDTQGQNKDDLGAQGVPPPATNPDPTKAAPTGGAAASGGTGNKTATRAKDNKIPSPPNHPPPFNTPPPQVLQLTPELFQQTVAAAVTAALAASVGQQGLSLIHI